MLYTAPMPKPEMKRMIAICQNVWHNAIRPVKTEKTSTAHHTTRTRPMRSESQPASPALMAIPSS